MTEKDKVISVEELKKLQKENRNGVYVEVEKAQELMKNYL